MTFTLKTATKTISGAVLSTTLIATAANAADLEIKTEEYAPVNFTNEAGEVTGIAAEIVRQTAEKAGVSISIESLPFKRSYYAAQQQPNACFLALWRTEAREDKFTWVGPLMPGGYSLFASANSDITLNTLEDSFDYTTGAVAGWGSTEAVRDAGHPNLQTVNNDEFNIRKLKRDRIDLWLSGRISAPYEAKKAGLDIKQVLAVKEVDYAIACNKDTDQATLDKMQKALDTLKAEGVVEEVKAKFM